MPPSPSSPAAMPTNRKSTSAGTPSRPGSGLASADNSKSSPMAARIAAVAAGSVTVASCPTRESVAMESSVRGSCLCGGVRYEFDGKVFLFNHCHCVQCRKAHGASFASNLHIRPDQFRWLAGESQVARFESSPGVRRSFCSVCGGSVAIAPDEQGVISAAAPDDPIDPRPMLHLLRRVQVGLVRLRQRHPP